MKKKLTITFLLFSILSIAQKSKKKDEIIEYTTKDGTHYTVGDTVYFGMGSRQDNNYAFVYSLPNFLNSSALPWGPIINGKFTIIDKIRQVGNESRGLTTIFIFKEKGYTGEHGINIEAAIEKGEVVTAASIKKKEEQKTPKIIQQSTISLADELKKLKELLDTGILTREEYEAQKQKLLEK